MAESAPHGPSPSLLQTSLFGREPVSIDPHFGSLERIDLGEGAWLELQRSWLKGDETLFSEMLAQANWRSEQREMYERTVAVPRLYALAGDAPALPIWSVMRRALDARYNTSFDRLSFAFYRDGKDSVAFHGDHVARRLPTALVATVSLGAPRKFLVRKYGGGPSRAWSLGSGDLLVMGGTCQRTFQHAIPKVSRAAPRMAVMFRPVWAHPEEKEE